MTGALPPALLAAALALALAFSAWRVIAIALAAFVATALVVTLLPIGDDGRASVFTGLWASVVLTAASVFLPQSKRRWLPLGLSLNAGAWAGATVAVAAAPPDLARALPVALVALPAAWIVARGGGLAVKVVASWLIAVAILAAALPLVPTPGYSSDHLG